jgi:hypothetical protein
VGIHAGYTLQIKAHPRRMQDNDGESFRHGVNTNYELNDGLWEIHANEIES